MSGTAGSISHMPPWLGAQQNLHRHTVIWVPFTEIGTQRPVDVMTFKHVAFEMSEGKVRLRVFFLFFF